MEHCVYVDRNYTQIGLKIINKIKLRSIESTIGTCEYDIISNGLFFYHHYGIVCFLGKSESFDKTARGESC